MAESRAALLVELVKLALGMVESCPFTAGSMQDLKKSIVDCLEQDAWSLGSQTGDREAVPTEKRFVTLLPAESRGRSRVQSG